MPASMSETIIDKIKKLIFRKEEKIEGVVKIKFTTTDGKEYFFDAENPHQVKDKKSG